MLINLGEILKKYNIIPKGIIHAGSHFCEEHEDYVSYGCKNFIYIEPCKDAFNVMLNKFDVNVSSIIENDVPCKISVSNRYGADFIGLINVACGAKEKTGVMYASNNNQGQSNSLLEPHLHLQQHPEIVFDEAEVVKVVTLDSLEISKRTYNILCMDVQGYEGEVLKGATKTLQNIDLIYTEVNRDSTYKGNMLIDEMDEFLFDFQRVETYWPSPNWSWGDACYIKKSLL